MATVKNVQQGHIPMEKEIPAQNASQMKKLIMMAHVEDVPMVLFLIKIEDFAFAVPKVWLPMKGCVDHAQFLKKSKYIKENCKQLCKKSRLKGLYSKIDGR